MDQIWNWVTTNSEGISALSTVILVVITAIYVVLTHLMLKDNRLTHEAALRPEVVPTIVLNEHASGFLNMVIENVGVSPAYEVSFSTEPGVCVRNKEPLDELGVFKNGITVLAPRQRIEFFLASSFEDFKGLMKTKLDIGVSWKDHAGKTTSREYPLRFDHLENLSELGTAPESKAAEALEKIENHFRSIGKRNSELRVVSYSPEELRLESGADRLYSRIHHLDSHSREKVENLVEECLSQNRNGTKG